jgi:hypothetical protein
VVRKTKSKKLSTKAIQKEFNHLIASGKPCAKCNQIFPVMQCSHVHSIGAYPNLRFDPMNALSMCGRHHNFWWHLEPTESWDWFKEKYPGRYQYLLIAKNKHVGWTQDKLLEVRRKVKERDLKGLLIMPELLLDNA